MTREPACSGFGHLSLVALNLGIGRVWHFDRTDQPNAMRGAGEVSEAGYPAEDWLWEAKRVRSTVRVVGSEP